MNDMVEIKFLWPLKVGCNFYRVISFCYPEVIWSNPGYSDEGIVFYNAMKLPSEDALMFKLKVGEFSV